MKTKKIIHKLELLLGINEAQKSRTKLLKTITKLIGLLEAKEVKFRNKISEGETQSDLPKYQRKLSLTEIHLTKARAHQQSLESDSN